MDAFKRHQREQIPCSCKGCKRSYGTRQEFRRLARARLKRETATLPREPDVPEAEYRYMDHYISCADPECGC